MSKIRAGILQQASGIPAAFDPTAYVASALVDQNWTGLGGTPGAWSVVGGTPDYNVDGVTQATGTTLALELDISGLAAQGPPAWLLVIAKFNDFMTVGFDATVQDTAGNNTMLIQFNGDGATETNTNTQRFEVAGPDCQSPNTYVAVLNPTGSTVYFGVVGRIADIAANQYAEGTQHFDDDPDGYSFGGFSSGPCTDVYTAHDLDKIVFSIHDLSGAGATTIIRTILWDSLPGNDNNNFNLVAAELGWLP